MVELNHIALLVPDLREAEAHYRTIFAADLIGREHQQDDGCWCSLPPDRGWEDAEAAGIELQWVGLRRDNLIIALLLGEPEAQPTLYCIGLTVTAEEVAELREHLPGSVTIEAHTDTTLTFVDRFGFRWQCSGPGFGTAGEVRGDWLDL
jgi:catechol 2,3-dioxygenase-like lactoylglutathione lyase family enzyme